MVRIALMAEESAGLVRGKPRFGWLDGEKVVLNRAEMTVGLVKQCVKIGRSGEEPMCSSDEAVIENVAAILA